MTTTQTTWVSITDVAQMLDLSITTVHKLAKTGKIPVYRFGRSYRFDQDEVQSWIDKQKITPKEQSQ